MRINVVNTLEIEIIKGRETVLVRCLHDFIARNERAPGCLAYGLTQSAIYPRLWLLSGYWDNQEALSAHCTAGELDQLIWQVSHQALGIRFSCFLASTCEGAR